MSSKPPGPKSKNIVWNTGKLSQSDRENKLQKGAVVWFTGLSGSGKSTVAREVEQALVSRGINAYVLDGDNVRHGLNANLGFSPEDRQENVRRVGEVSKLFCYANVIALSAFISPYRADRDSVRALIPLGRFFEIYCAASAEDCEKRDVMGLYRKARAGEIPEFTGVSAPYETPLKPELILQTGGQESVAESAQKVLELLQKKGII